MNGFASPSKTRKMPPAASSLWMTRSRCSTGSANIERTAEVIDVPGLAKNIEALDVLAFRIL